MLIRAEQMIVFETTAEENFVRRIADHLRENYAPTVVRLPAEVESNVAELDEEKLHSLVKVGIARARTHHLTFESSIVAFSTLMFEVAPNFDAHQLAKTLLADESLEPEKRLDEMLQILSDKNWDTIRAEYDVNAWQPKPEIDEKTGAEESSDDPADSEFAKTVMNVQPPEMPKIPPVPNAGAAQSSGNFGSAAPTDFPPTVPNIKIGKE